ncbi:hypothetical protein QQS21_001380 [Conoideocrella luteorostrata]|uniref:AB hydrolase-1 domain-containing protein n=1 Tax=Conoideocrella luteorostrata TaxID=1105319 RepID=A0AAJ0D039_9HYPO|nr:hypothetical protein QQS21_001380 [Conoideocrella luteorostrata]
MATSADLGDLILPDGRTLHFAIYGDVSAIATIFFHHGLPGSHVETRIFDKTARRHHIRIIGVDRPGMGNSTFQPDNRLLDWPANLLALAEHLQVQQFAVLGVSGGAPYVLACLREIPRARCVGGGIIAGVYPASLGWAGMAFETRLLFTVGAWTTWLVEKTLEYVLGAVARDTEHPEKLEAFLEKTFDSRPEADRAVWDQNKEQVRTILVEDSRHALRNGSRGAAWETYLVANDWGFKLEDISMEGRRLVMWHGALDANWPVGMARRAQPLLAGAELRVSESDGHVSIFANKVEEVMETMGEVLSD